MTTSPTTTAHTLVGDGVQLSVMAEGARITSLLDSRHGRQWLEQPGATHGARPFDEGEMGGWDEMMPTITACRYPGTTTELSDHGEVWRRPWTLTSTSATSLTATIDGAELDYRLERTLSLEGRILRLAYRLTSPVEGLHYLWAAHPLFAVRPTTRLVVGPRDSGDEVVLSSDLAPGESRKYFESRDEASLVDEDGASLTMRWSAHLGSVGVWLDHGAYARHPVVGIEPTNVPFDSLADAVESSATAPLFGERRWSIDVVFGD